MLFLGGFFWSEALHNDYGDKFWILTVISNHVFKGVSVNNFFILNSETD